MIKRKTVSFLTLICSLLLSVVCFASCVGEGEIGSVKVLEKNENLVVIEVESAGEGATLFDALKWLEEKGELEFASESGAYGESLLSLNGKANPADWSYYWTSYVCDETQGNVDVKYGWNGNDYYYANYGISSLTVKDGGVYLWAFEESAW